MKLKYAVAVMTLRAAVVQGVNAVTLSQVRRAREYLRLEEA